MTIRDLAILARLPNLPTVWSNVVAGYLLALVMARDALAGTAVEPALDGVVLAWLVASATLLYLFGTYLNDAVDVEFDARHRVDRPIPSGRVSREVVLNLGLFFGLAGLAAAIPAGKFALGVVGAIVVAVMIYTWLHKRTVLAGIFMGLCRGLLPVLGGAGVLIRWGDDLAGTVWLVLGAGGLMFCYTLGVSLLARGESIGGTGTWTGRAGRCLLALPFVLPALVLAWYFAATPEASGWQAGAMVGVASCPGLAWVWFAVSGAKDSISTMVGRALAGLPLVDLLVLTPVWLVEPPALLVPATAFALALLCRRFIPST